MKKRILSLVLALSMMISLFPVSALAQAPGGGTAVLAEENGTTEGTTGSITINNSGVPVTDGLAIDNDGYWIGAGWKYIEGVDAGHSTLTLMSGTWDFTKQNAVKCDVMILKDAVVSGGTFEGIVWNEVGGKISGGTFKKTVSNKGTITGGIFVGVDLENTSVINYDTGKITGGVFENNVTNGDSGDEGISASITGGLFKAKVQNKAASAAITGGVFVTKPTGSGTIANGYTLTTRGTSSKFLYAADGKEIDLGQSVYVVPNTNENDVLKVAGTGITEWDVVVGDDTYELTSWTGAQMQSGSKDTFVLKQDVVTTQDATVTLKKHKAYNTALEIGADGKPVTENRKPNGNGGVQGDGWTYDGTTLKLNPTSAKEFTLNSAGTTIEGAYLNCDLEIGENATVKGTIALTRKVTNNGTIDKLRFGGDGEGHYPSLTNNGTVQNCSIEYASVTNNKKMENVSIVACSSLENTANATIENVVVRKFGKEISYSNLGSIDNAVFEFNPKIDNVHVLKASSGETVGATLSGIKAVVFGTEVYIVGEPEVKVKISGSNKETITNINGNTSYGGLTVNKDGEDFQTFTVQKDDEELVLNKTISPTYNENLVIGTDGKPDTANSEPDGKGGWKGANWTYDGTTLTLTGAMNWSFSQYPAVTCPVALGCNTGLIGGTFEKAVTGGTNSYVDRGIFLSTVNVAKIDSGIFKTAPNGTTCYTVKAGDSSKLGVKVNGAEFVDFGTDEAQVVNRIGNFVFSVQLRDANGDVVKIANINGKEIGFDAYGSYNVDNSTAVRFTMPSENVVLNQEPTTKTYTLTVDGGYIGTDENQTSGNYEAGATIKLTAEDAAEGKEFDKWELDGLTLVDGCQETNATIEVTINGNATAKATYKDKAPTTYTLTVEDGYIGTDENQTSSNYEAGATIKLTAKAKTGYHFTKWTVEEGTLSLSEEKLKANPLTFEMPDGAVSLKANYEEDTPDPVDPNPTPNPDDQPKTYTVTVKGGKINNETEVKAAKGTKLTVDVDESEVPEGMTFDVWSIRFPESVKDTLTGDSGVMLHDPHMSFAMPEADITIEAQYRSSELPGEDDGPSTLGTMATVAVGGAAAGILVWQGVSLGVDSYLQLNLPKGVAVPANRRELVVLLWETAGKPEAALPSLYSDVPAEEIELQKATRWAIDNGLVKPADDSDASRFDPDRYVTKYDVFGAWLKLKKLMK